MSSTNKQKKGEDNWRNWLDMETEIKEEESDESLPPPPPPLSPPGLEDTDATWNNLIELNVNSTKVI